MAANRISEVWRYHAFSRGVLASTFSVPERELSSFPFTRSTRSSSRALTARPSLMTAWASAKSSLSHKRRAPVGAGLVLEIMVCAAEFPLSAA
jgi:hypothetical protein